MRHGRWRGSRSARLFALAALCVALSGLGCAGNLWVTNHVEYEDGPDGTRVAAERTSHVALPWAFGYGTASGAAESLGLDPRAASEDPAGSPTRVVDAREIAGAHGGRATPTGAEAAQGILPSVFQFLGRLAAGAAGGGG